jgi:Fic family protein
VSVAEHVTARWERSWDAPHRPGLRAGTYRSYVPDPLEGRPLSVDSQVTRQAAVVEAAVRALADGPGARGLEGLARFLLRSEAIASSRIEGLQVSAQQVALAEFADAEGMLARGFTANAKLVANNIVALRRSAVDLAATPEITIEGIVDLHRALLPDDRHPGLREVQNWIGGDDWNPIGAEFVPPPPDRVPALMADLVEYMNGGVHAPLIQAAMVHAQFETVHPFTDGNGRVGRALIHAVLSRRGLTRTAVVPVSLVLLTRSEEYVAGLTAYRYLGSADAEAAQAGLAEWFRVFLDAVDVAARQALEFADALAGLQARWAQHHQEYRRRSGLRPQPRTNAAVGRLLDLLPEVPVMTVRTARRLLDVSFPAARSALEELAEVGIVHRKQVDRGTTGYLARDVFALLTYTERRLASTRWDTREALPGRPVPARPKG